MGQMKLSSIPYENVITIVKKLRNREYIEIFRSCKAMNTIAEKRDYRPVLQNDEEKKLSIHFFSRYFSPQPTAASGMVLNVDLDDSYKQQQAAISSTLKQLEGEIFTSIRICSAANSTHFELFCRKVCKLLKEYNITSRHMKWDIEDRQELMSQAVDDLKCASLSTESLKDAKFLHTNDRIICIRTPKPLFDPILFSKCTHLKFSSMARLEEEVFLCRNQLSQFTKTIMLLHSFGKYQESLATKDTLSLGMGSISLEMVTNSYTKDAIIDYTKRVCKENSFQKIYDIPSDEYEDSCRIQLAVYQFDVFLSVLLCPITLPNAYGLQFSGVLGVEFPNSGNGLTSCIVVSLLIVGLSIILSFVWREYSLIHFVATKKRIIVYAAHFSLVIFVGTLFVPFYSMTASDMPSTIAYLQTVNSTRDPNLAVFAILPEKTTMLMCLMLQVLAFCASAFSYVAKAIYKVTHYLKSTKTRLSKRTIMLHRTLLRSLIFQIVVPIALFCVPWIILLLIITVLPLLNILGAEELNTVQQHTAAIMYCIPAFFSTAHFLTVVHFTQPYQQFFLGRFYKQPTTAIVTALGASGTTR